MKTNDDAKSFFRFAAIDVEIARRLASDAAPAEQLAGEVLDMARTALADEAERQRIASLFATLQSAYDAIGSSFAHPVRVTASYLLAGEGLSYDSISLAISHNIREVGKGNLADIEDAFLSPQVQQYIGLLTIKRSRERDPAYLTDYYDRILDAGLMVLKGHDKLDNFLGFVRREVDPFYYGVVDDYVSGRYFSGRASEIKNTGRALGDVLGGLAGLAGGEVLTRTRPSYFSDAEVDLMSEISSVRARWVTLFGAANAAVMADGWHIAEREFPALRKVAPDLNSRAKRLTHFDLHPHNILLRDDELVAVLDFDACHQMPVELAIAFATLKLMKRVEVERLASSRAGTLTEDVNVFLAAVAETLPERTADRALLCNFAKAEAMRRLLSVCRRHMAGRTFLWNDIPVHLAALAEADVIF